MSESPFATGPDPVMGAALRRALDAGDDRPFVARVLAALAAPRPRTWEVLAAWAQRGLAAAAAAALVAGLLLARARVRTAPGGQLDEVFAAAVAAGGAPAELAAGAPPDPSIALATLDER